MTRRPIIILALVPTLFAAALIAMACGNDNYGKSPTQAPASAATSPAVAAATSPTAAAGGAANNITIENFSYNPARFNARAGQQLRLTITNRDSAPHTFTIDGVVDSGTLSSGQSKVLEFTPSQAGALTYYCKVHGAATMSGQLTVAGTTGALPDTPSGGQPTSAGAPAADPTPSGNYDYGY